jgi:hypothetical protein
MKLINPYNFVPLGNRGPIFNQWHKTKDHHRFGEETYSGHLRLIISTVTPIFIPSRLPEDVDIEIVKKDGEEKTKTTFLRFHHNGQEMGRQPTFPGTSLKGMIRAVFEALTDSCMVLFAETYGRYTYPAPKYKNQTCNSTNGLCPACATFGTIQGNDLLLQGKVRFSDAIGTDTSIRQGEWNLKILSSPKPEKSPAFYAKDGSTGNRPRGRKFYFHHNPEKVNINNYDYLAQKGHTLQNVKINQLLPEDVQLTATLDFTSLTEDQLAFLLFAVELGYEPVNENGVAGRKYSLGHKIGMGKPRGLGSITIAIDTGKPDEFFISKGSARYTTLHSVSPDLPSQINRLRELAKKKLENNPAVFQRLTDILSLNKGQEGTIQYAGREKLVLLEDGTLVQPSQVGKEVISEVEPFPINDPLPSGEQVDGVIIKSEGINIIIKSVDGRLFRRSKSVQHAKAAMIAVGLEVTLKDKTVYLRGKAPS